MKRTAVSIALCASVCLGAQAAALAAAPDHSEENDLYTAPPQAAQEALDKVQKDTARAMKEAERAMKEAERVFKFQARSAGEPGEGEPGIEAELANNFPEFRTPGPGSSSTQPLIVRFSAFDREADASLREDLPVMNRILTKTVEGGTGRGGADFRHAMGIVLSTLPGARRPQSLYLEGYGALFLLSVDFPLVASENETKETQEKPADSTWEEAKRELYGQRRVEVRLYADDARTEFDAEKVENLQTELLKVLKNAANIRELKAEEFVTVVLTGSGRPGSDRLMRSQLTTGDNARKARLLALARPRSAPENTLTIRVKKADATAFSEGSIDLQEFTKRASVSAY